MNAIQKFIEAEHKYLDLNEIDYKEYEQMVEPLRDVECVVRCKDCKFYLPDKAECSRHHFVIFFSNGGWYCADGERKDGDGEWR